MRIRKALSLGTAGAVKFRNPIEQEIYNEKIRKREERNRSVSFSELLGRKPAREEEAE